MRADDGEQLVDEESGAKWDLALGLAQNEEANGDTLLRSALSIVF